MTRRPARLLFVFLDGVGIGTDDPARNPFARAVIPTLLQLMGGRIPTLDAPRVEGAHGRSFPLDASLCGTGQAALLTGANAPALFGRHFGPWTPVSLRPLVEERSILRRAGDAGAAVAFANAYPRGWPGPRGDRRVAGPPLAARAAGLLVRHHEDLGRGRAVSSEIVNDAWRRHLGHLDLPAVTEAEAGRNLARIAADAEFTLYAHYATDTAGHRGGMEGGVAALERVDRFLAGVREELPDDVTLLLASDHGNLEEVGAGHTLNPALGVASGPLADLLADGTVSLTDVAPAAARALGLQA